MTIRINDEKVFRLIEDKKPRAILVNSPGGLLKQAQLLMDKIKTKYGIPCVLTGESCYGICDTVDEDVSRLGADMALHIGHNAAIENVGDYTYLIDAVDDVEFDAVIVKAISAMREYGSIGLVTFSQHLHRLPDAKAQFERSGFHVMLGKGNSLLLESQIFGCDFSTVYHLRNEVDAFCFLGESEFHAVGLALATSRPTYMLDPYLNEVIDMKDAAEERRRRAILAVYKSLDAKTFGVITGLKEGQKMLGRSAWIAKRLEMHGRKVRGFAMREITAQHMEQFRDVDAFIQTACPRISIDGFTFGRPVLSIPQADALVSLLEGRDIGEFLHRPKWIELTVGLIRK